MRNRILPRLPVAVMVAAAPIWAAGAARAQREAEASATPPVPALLSLDEAVRYALQFNPELAAARQQRGIAAAGVVIAGTYPFNPVLENRVQAAGGPLSAGITNRLPLEHILVWELEIRGQRTQRRSEASAALSRTEWEIANQEQLLAVRVIRSFRNLIYQREKVRLLEETLRLDERLVNQVRTLQGKLGAAELIVARTEAADARALLGAGRIPLLNAGYELRRALGVVQASFEVDGKLELPPTTYAEQPLMEAALDLRADLHARQAAVQEAQARLRLALADRYGNPSIGPAYTYDPSRISSIGAQINFPLPVFNTHKGEVMQKQAEVARAGLDLRQVEVSVRQDVETAVARLNAARGRVAGYRDQIIPEIRKGLARMQQLFASGDPTVDVLRVIDVQRKLLHARDGFIDALGDLNQAQADLVAAVGDLGLALSAAPSPVIQGGAVKAQ